MTRVFDFLTRIWDVWNEAEKILSSFFRSRSSRVSSSKDFFLFRFGHSKGRAERKHRHIMETLRALLLSG